MPETIIRPLRAVVQTAAGVMRERHSRPSLSFIAWSAVDGRSFEIARDLGGEARCFYDFGIRRGRLVPIRYAVSSARTIAYLAIRRPRAVIVTNPPVIPVLIAYAYSRLARVPIAIDSHPTAFGLKNYRLGQRLLPVSRWLSRRAASTLVASPTQVATVSSWGGNADIVHEAPPAWSVAGCSPIAGRPRVLFICTFGPDEPTAEVLEAAREVPDVDIRVTGDLRRLGSIKSSAAPANVTFVGFLRGDSYRDELERADVVLTLSTEPQSVMRSAYEAVYAQRPMVLSGGDGVFELFPHAVRVENNASSIAAGIRAAVRDHAGLRAAVSCDRARQTQRWADQVSALRARLGLDSRASAGAAVAS